MRLISGEFSPRLLPGAAPSPLVAARYDALEAVRRDEFRWGTRAEADAAAGLHDLFPAMARVAARTACEEDSESRGAVPGPPALAGGWP